MSSKYSKDSAEVGLSAVHPVYGNVELIGRVEHSGDCSVWVVECWDKGGEFFKNIVLVYEDDLTDLHYWGD